MRRVAVILFLFTTIILANESWSKFQFGKDGCPKIPYFTLTNSGFWVRGNEYRESDSINADRLVYFDGDKWQNYFYDISLTKDLRPPKIEDDSLLWFSNYVDNYILQYNYKTGMTEKYECDDSLSIGSIQGISSDGVKWFSASDGAIAFNGENLTFYDSSNSTLDSNFTNYYYFDKSGNTYITWMQQYGDTYGEWGGLSVFDGENWGFYDSSNSPLPHNYINDIFVDKKDDKWIGTNQGLIRLSDTGWTVFDTLGLDTALVTFLIREDSSKDIWIRLYNSDYQGCVLWNGSSFEFVDTKDLNDQYHWQPIINDREGLLWGDTRSKGIIHKEGSEWINYNSSNVSVCNGYDPKTFDQGEIITIWDDGTLWYQPSGIATYGGYRGIVKFEPSLNKWTEYTPYNTNLANDTIHSQITTKTGTTYTATNYGLSAQTIDGDWSAFDTNIVDNFPINEISAMTIDRGGNLWCSTNNYSAEFSLAKFDGTTWTTFDSTTTGVRESYSLATDSTGTIWVGTRAGLISYDGSNFKKEDNSYLPNIRVLSIAIGKDNSKWFATSDGLAKLKDGNWTTIDMSSLPINSDNLTSVTVDTEGIVWCGSLLGGLMSYNGSNWTSYRTDNCDIPENIIRAVKADSFGNIWAATEDSGVVKFDGTNWTHYDSSNSELQDNRVRSIAVSANGSKWFGTAYNGIANLVDDDSLLIVGIKSTKTAKLAKAFTLTTKNNRLKFSLTELTNVSFTIFDLKGRIIERKNLGALDSGKHTIMLQKRGTGMYMMQLKIGNRVENRKISIK